MSQGVPKYPISLLLNRLIYDSGLSRVGFIRSLRYRNIPKGLRRLDAWLLSGEGHPVLIDRIVAVYAGRFDPLELSLALAATRVLKSVEVDAAAAERLNVEYRTFRPYVFVEGERSVPSSITLFAITGGRWNFIDLPDHLVSAPFADQIAALPGLCRDYLKQYRGACPFFGATTAFRFVRWAESIRFTLEGQAVEVIQGRFRRPHTTVTIGHKTVGV